MGVRRSVKVSAGYCSDSDVMVTAVAASALLEGGACAAPGRPTDVPVWVRVCGAAIPSLLSHFRVACVNWRWEEGGLEYGITRNPKRSSVITV
jgi:hypothetical protein